MRYFNTILWSLAVLVLSGCQILQERRELHTLANLQALAARLQDVAEDRASVEKKDFDSVVQEYFKNGKDPWGNPIVFVSYLEGGKATFLLISIGSDGTLDVANEREYFEVDEPVSPLREDGRDIVMRGVTVISYGAHK